MKLSELVERLTQVGEDLDYDPEVELMTQEHWPFRNTIHDIVTQEQIDECRHDEEGEDYQANTTELSVFIVECMQLGYGDKAAWRLS